MISNRKELQELMNEMAANLITNCERLAFISIGCDSKYSRGDAKYVFSSELYDSVPNGGDIPARRYQDFIYRPLCKESLSRFVMKGLELSPEVHDVLNSSLNNVRSIKLQGCILNNDSNNINLKTLSIQHLDTLSMDQCIFDKDPTNNNVTMDLSSI